MKKVRNPAFPVYFFLNKIKVQASPYCISNSGWATCEAMVSVIGACDVAVINAFVYITFLRPFCDFCVSRPLSSSHQILKNQGFDLNYSDLIQVCLTR